MSNVADCKERDIALLHQQYQSYSIDRDAEGKPTAPHPNGVGPWSTEESREDRARWQKQLDETGVIADDAKLTRHKLQLAKWVAHTEEIMGYEGEIPKKVMAAAERTWATNFKEPKIKGRQQTIQMFLALPPSEVDNFGGFPTGILWATNEEGSHLTVAEVGAAVVAHTEGKGKYKENPVDRAKIDIGKFNRGQFDCMNGKKPDTRYPLLGLPKPEKKEKVTETAETETASA